MESQKGKGDEESLSLLEELAEVVADTSLCGLGKTAPNPVLSALRYFRSEFEAHIHQKRCPAAVCTPLIQYSISERIAQDVVPVQRSVRHRRSKVRRSRVTASLPNSVQNAGPVKMSVKPTP